MKKIILSLSILALLTSCGSKEKKEAQSNTSTEESVKDVPKELSFTSFDLLNKFKEGQEDFLNSLKGNNVTITQILYQSGSEKFMYAWGYNGSEMTLYSNPESGFSNIVRGNVALANPGPNLGFELTNLSEENPKELVPFEMNGNDKGTDETFHTMFTVFVNGDDIQSKNQTTLTIDGARIIAHENF